MGVWVDKPVIKIPELQLVYQDRGIGITSWDYCQGGEKFLIKPILAWRVGKSGIQRPELYATGNSGEGTGIPSWDNRGGSFLASRDGIKRPELQRATQSWTKGFLLGIKGESIYSYSSILAGGLMDQKIRIITGNSKIG